MTRTLHAPLERELVARLGDWEIRRHPQPGPHHAYFAPRGFLHLQLWHPTAEISVLTPSRLTGGRFELWRDGVRISVSSWSDVTERLSDLALPSELELAALHRWTVIRDTLEASPGPRPADAAV